MRRECDTIMSFKTSYVQKAMTKTDSAGRLRRELGTGAIPIKGGGYPITSELKVPKGNRVGTFRDGCVNA